MNKNWISMHIFYASYANPMLVDCIDPLVDQLRERGLIRRYFFIKYWEEGSHIRLRLLPAEGVEQETIKRVVEPVIEDYLKRRPALYSADQERVNSYFKELFLAEYGEEKWEEKYGKDGQMTLRPNNSFAYIEYEPEHNRYGGIAGIEIAEWHFEKSSEIVTRLLRETNVHVRSILLGLSVQLSMALCYGFLEEDQKVIDFLSGYMRFWQERYPQYSDALYPGFDKKYARMSVEIQRRVSQIRSYMVEGTSTSLTAIEREWIAHIRELRQRIKQLAEARQFVFQSRDEEGEQIVIDDLNAVYNILLSSYIHMTNNRLGVAIPDEVYLSYILKRSLDGKVPAVQEVR